MPATCQSRSGPSVRSVIRNAPPGGEGRPWGGELTPGWFYSDNLSAARAHLFAQGHVPRVAGTHKKELRKLVVQLGTERLTIAREPEHALEIAAFCTHFGLEYRGSTLCAAVGAVMEKLLRPKRAAFSDKQRDEVYEAQGHRGSICDAELRAGEDHGDHVDVLRDQVAGQEQKFRLLCATCNLSIRDPAQRRDSAIQDRCRPMVGAGAEQRFVEANQYDLQQLSLIHI